MPADKQQMMAWCAEARRLLTLPKAERAHPQRALMQALGKQQAALAAQLAAAAALAKLTPELISTGALHQLRVDLDVAKSLVSFGELATGTKELGDAAELLESVHKRIEVFNKALARDKAGTVATVKAAHTSSLAFRDRLQGQMAALVPAGAGAPPTAPELAQLRQLAEQEFTRDAALAELLKAADTLELGLPPAAARTPFGDASSPGAELWDATVCENAFKAYTWFDLKALRKTQRPVPVTGLPAPGMGVVTDAVMWKLYQYRRHVIDGLIAGFQREHAAHGLKFKSMGSEDIESDLDITVASPNSAMDVVVMRAFNNAIKTRFGRPPGRVFDTNLYARDYKAIEDNMTKPKDLPAGAAQDRDIAEPIGEMKKLANIDQDVATLMKQRRFMDADSFTQMWEDLQASMPRASDRKKIQQHFEEGEALYLQTTVEKVEKIAAKIDAKLRAFNSAANQDPALRQRLQDYERLNTELMVAHSLHEYATVQRLLPTMLDFLEEHFEDEVMDATDDIYADRMAEMRDAQLLVQAREESLAMLKSQVARQAPPPNPADVAQIAALEKELNAARARIKQAQFTNIVFANEAYVSQGALKHIVAGKQANNPEELARIEPAELLQSTNEQMADFLKDMKHMEHAERAAANATEQRRASGEAFVHASKYLSRMLEAVAMLQAKYKDRPALLAGLSVPQYQLLTDAGVDTPAQLQQLVDQTLVRLRKSATVPGAVKAEMAVAEVQQLFQTPTIAALRAKIQAFCMDFNGRVRQMDAFRNSQTLAEGNAAATIKEYFSAGAN